MNRDLSSDWDQRRHAPLATGLMLQRAKIAKSNSCLRCSACASLALSGGNLCTGSPRPPLGQSSVSITLVRCLAVQQTAQEMADVECMSQAMHREKRAKVWRSCLMSPALPLPTVLTSRRLRAISQFHFGCWTLYAASSIVWGRTLPRPNAAPHAMVRISDVTLSVKGWNPDLFSMDAVTRFHPDRK